MSTDYWKQPESEEWVFNVNTQMTVQGRLIPKDEQKFVLIKGDVKLPQLSNVTGGKKKCSCSSMNFAGYVLIIYIIIIYYKTQFIR